jgi:hypothetical protein
LTLISVILQFWFGINISNWFLQPHSLLLKGNTMQIDAGTVAMQLTSALAISGANNVGISIKGSNDKTISFQNADAGQTGLLTSKPNGDMSLSTGRQLYLNHQGMTINRGFGQLRQGLSLDINGSVGLGAMGTDKVVIAGDAHIYGHLSSGNSKVNGLLDLTNASIVFDATQRQNKATNFTIANLYLKVIC